MRKLTLMLPVMLIMSINDVLVAQEFSDKYIFVGSTFKAENILSAEQMEEKYKGLKAGDTISISFQAEVYSVCKKKGCWMELSLDNSEPVMVKFRDYAFFVPKDIDGKEVIVNGKAYIEIMSVEEQQHFAQDAGAKQEEIEATVKPKNTFSFIADGVKIKK